MKNYLLLFAVLSLLVSCCKSGKEESPKVISVRMNAEFIIPEKDIEHFKALALNGSLEKAGKLSQYYSLAKYDNKNEIYWLEIGIEGGAGASAMYNLAFDLSLQTENPVSILRARFWAESAKANNPDIEGYIFEKIMISMKELKPEISEIPLMERRALLGDGKAAIRVANQYHSKGDATKELYWTRIAVQNSDFNAIPRLAELLKNSPDPQDQMRANYWNNLSKRAVVKVE